MPQKNGATRRSPSRPDSLQAGDVRCLQTFGGGGFFELNRLAFVQRLISLRLDGGEMDEDVLAGLALDESKPLAGIEPLYCSLFFHGISFSYILSYLVPLDRLQPYNKKGLQVLLASPLIESKGVTRATNA